MRTPTLTAVLITLAAVRDVRAQEPDASVSAPAETEIGDTPAYRARLELRSGLSYRRESFDAAALSTRSSGIAPSSFALGGQAFLQSLPLGLGGHLHVDRFGLRPRDQLEGFTTLRSTHLEAAVVALARGVFSDGRLAVQGGLGYELQRLPMTRLAAGAPMTLEAASLLGHGPVIEAALEANLGRRLSVEASARGLPVSFGGRYDGQDVTVRALAAGAAVGFGHVDAGNVRFVGLVGYELAHVSGGEGALDLSQTLHRVGFGVRAAFLPPPRRAPVVAQDRPVVPATPARPTARVRGVVRAAPETPGGPPGAPLGGIRVAVAGGPAVVTAADGTFSLEGLAIDPGAPVPLSLTGEGWRASEEAVVLPVVGPAEVDVVFVLRRASADQPALLNGLVRTESGRPIGATVAVEETGLTTRADGRGFFKLSLPPGEYTLSVTAPGFAPQRKRVRVIGGEQSIHNIDMQRERR